MLANISESTVCARNDFGGPFCQLDKSMTHALCAAVSYISPILSLGSGSHVGREFSQSLATRILASVMRFYGDNRSGYT